MPIKLLHESEGHIVTIETKNGELYRGELYEAEDNWNCQMRAVQMTGRNGQQRMIQNVYIRGSKIRFIIVPDMMKNAPMFKRVDPKYKDKLPKMGESGYARKNHVRRTDKRP